MVGSLNYTKDKPIHELEEGGGERGGGGGGGGPNPPEFLVSQCVVDVVYSVQLFRTHMTLQFTLPYYNY